MVTAITGDVVHLTRIVQITRLCQVAPSALMAYDYLICIDQEVEILLSRVIMDLLTCSRSNKYGNDLGRQLQSYTLQYEFALSSSTISFQLASIDTVYRHHLWTV
ncbi:hypothetical protein V8B97DRAFT_584982 [Scleroderma yunnanense]